MNRKLLVVILSAVLIAFAPFASAEPQTEIQIRDITPKPAAPGDTITVDLLVRNIGDSEGSYLPLKIESTNAIPCLGITSNFEDEFSLSGGSQTVGTVYLKVNENATSGSYPLNIVANATENAEVSEEEAVIEVDSTPNIIATSNVEVKQGESSQFGLKIENIGKDDATQVTVSLDHPGLNFNPSTVMYGDLDVDESLSKPIIIAAKEDIPSGPTKAQATIEYVDDNERLIQEQLFSIQILKDVELVVSNIKRGAPKQGSKSRIMVELENIGNSEAESINSQITCEGATEDQSQDFVGSLDAGESVPTVYYITPDQESVECRLNVSYMGEEEQSLEETFALEAERGLFSFLFQETFTLEANPGLLAIIGVLVLAGAFLLYYKMKG